jgi:hypothetical protein
VIVFFLLKNSSYVAAALPGGTVLSRLPGASKRPHVPIHFPNKWGEDCYGCKILFVLTPLAFVRGASFCTHQCLRRPHTFRYVGHVHAMTVDLLVQVPTALPSHTEAERLNARINHERLQFTTILTSAGNLHLLPPVFGRFGRLSLCSGHS